LTMGTPQMNVSPKATNLNHLRSKYLNLAFSIYNFAFRAQLDKPEFKNGSIYGAGCEKTVRITPDGFL